MRDIKRLMLVHPLDLPLEHMNKDLDYCWKEVPIGWNLVSASDNPHLINNNDHKILGNVITYKHHKEGSKRLALCCRPKRQPLPDISTQEQLDNVYKQFMRELIDNGDGVAFLPLCPLTISVNRPSLGVMDDEDVENETERLDFD